MLTDVVIDTNVFLHAQNSTENRFLAAKEFLETLLKTTTSLCIDGVFDLKAPHRSLIAHEYLAHIPPTGLGYSVLVQLLQSGRVRMNVSTRLPPEKRRLVVRLVPRDSRDRTFIFVSYNSEESMLTSHDWVDFTSNVRVEVKNRLGVTIEEASDTVTRIAAEEAP